MKKAAFLVWATASAAAFATDWISVPDAPIATEADKKAELAAPGTSWFCRDVTLAKDVKSATWSVSGLGVFEIYVNGTRIGNDFLKPGFSHARKTKIVYSYDVAKNLRRGANTLVAEVSAGWWRDAVAAYEGVESAFWGELKIVYADDSTEMIVTDAATWKGALSGPILRAGIFDGEIYDARIAAPVRGDKKWKSVKKNTEFKGALVPTAGAEVTLRRDKAMMRGPYSLKKGETIVVDFGQNCAAIPEFRFKAKAGTVLTCLPGEMVNDAPKGQRGSDGPKGSVYRANLRCEKTGIRLDYTFAGTGEEFYRPRFTFFGYRYLSLTATDDVEIASVTTIPVTSITKEMELGTIETGHKDVNRLISNIYWGQLSNYLSIPTDCPQRNERQGWTADTQVFTEAGAFNADTYDFMRKYLRDMRDSQTTSGSYAGTAPAAGDGVWASQRFGWADCGIIVPYVIWRQFGKTEILSEHWDSMETFLAFVAENRYVKDRAYKRQYGDWLSYESNKPEDNHLYWKYLGGCYWLMDARMMSEMAAALGKSEAQAKYAKMAEEALAYLKKDMLENGKIPAPLAHLQTPALFALHCGILDPAAAAEAKAALLANIKAHGDCLQTGFLGTSIIMDTLTEIGASEMAYTLLLQHKDPSWLYSVDQGATTIWERWNSYTKKGGFGNANMNSFNHYAYGSVLAWIYKTAAGIASDPKAPGFANVIMAPKPDRRIGFVKASYRTPHGVVKSAWRYEGEKWIWDFTVPKGVTATVTLPGETASKNYPSGTYHIEK